MTRPRPYTTLPRRAHLGVEVSPKPSEEGGARVVGVSAGSTAARAGVAPGDVIVEIGDRRVLVVADLVAGMRAIREGQIVRVVVLRDGQRHERQVPAGALPKEHPSVSLDHVVGPHGAWQRAIYTTPAGPGPHPAVLYLQSSDWGSCEHPLTPRHPVRRLLLGLTEAGFATLRVERSGTGDSEGPPISDVDFAHELEGYRAGLSQLRDRHETVFLFGNSLGGMVAPLLADDEMAGLVVIGTSAKSWHACLLGSFRREAERAERAPEAIDADVALLAELEEQVLREGKTPEAVYRERPHLALAGFTHYAGTEAYGRTVTFFQQLEAIDLNAAWSRVRVPVLALHGADDWICTIEDAREIAERVGAAARVKELVAVDHGLAAVDAVTTVVDTAAAWMRQQLRR